MNASIILNQKKYLLVLLLAIASLLVCSFFYMLDRSAGLSISTTYGSVSDDLTINNNYFVSQDDSLDISEALILDEFVPMVESRVPISFGPQAYWYKYHISNKASVEKNLTLFFDNYVIAEIDVHRVVSGRVINSVYLGNSRRQKDLEYLVLPNYEFKLSSNESITLIVRSQSKGSANLPFIIFSKSDFENYKQNLLVLWGAFCGLMLVMIMYNLILFLGIRDTVYLYYVGYIISIFIDMAMLHGFVVLIFPYIVVEYLTQYLTAIHYFIIFFAVLFAMRFLRFDKENKNVYRICKGICYLLVPFCISTFFMEEYIAVQIFFLIQTSTYIYISYLLFTKFKNNFHWAKYYFISWLPLYVGGAITPLFFIGVLDYAFWIRNALLVSVMAEATLMAMALASRLKLQEDEIIYAATHNPVVKMANESLMSSVINSKLNADKDNYKYTIIAVEIQNYNSFSPYLNKNQIKVLYCKLISIISDDFKAISLLPVDSVDTNMKHFFTIQDGVFAMVADGFDTGNIKSSISSIEKKFPIIIDLNNIKISIRCVFGLALSLDGDHPLDISKKALQVINAAKANSVFYAQYAPSLVGADQRKIRLAADLQSALNHNALELYQQPQIFIKDTSPSGSEGLLRWNHPEFGFIPPNEFILIAENTGMIYQLTRWVVKQAIEQQQFLINSGYYLTLSINISALDIMSDDFCHFMINSVSKSGILFSLLVLEITETAEINNQTRFSENLLILSKVGFLIAIDDFGTGYASLNYLSEHPIDELKIDQMFISQLSNTPKSEFIVKSTLLMSKNLNLKVVAEGVENKNVANKLKEYNCDIAQGFYYAKPMRFHDYVEWLKNNY